MSLHLSDVTLTYPDGDSRLTALDNVSLDVPAGSVTAVIGPSGSGKSSLLAVAATLVTPDSGEVVIDGISTAGKYRNELTELRRRKVGIVFQQPNLLASLTAIEQLEVMAHIDGRSPREVTARARELLDQVGLAGKAGSRPGHLSGGQQQRINIARALMNNPAVLLVDEPTSALDQERGAGIIDLFTTITHRDGIATVLVTHDQSHLGGMDAMYEVIDGTLTFHKRGCNAACMTWSAPGDRWWSLR